MKERKDEKNFLLMTNKCVHHMTSTKNIISFQFCRQWCNSNRKVYKQRMVPFYILNYKNSNLSRRILMYRLFGIINIYWFFRIASIILSATSSGFNIGGRFPLYNTKNNISVNIFSITLTNYFRVTPSNMPVLIKLGQTTVVLMPSLFKLCSS